MKIKHWQGYGTVKARKIGDLPTGNGRERMLRIRVSGNHECGLVSKSIYDVHRWLLKGGDRFVSPKGAIPSYDNIRSVEIDDLYDMDENEDVAIYKIVYDPAV